MIALYILLGFLGILLLLLLIPGGVLVVYSSAGLSVKAAYGPIHFRLVPKKKKAPKKKTEKPEKKKAAPAQETPKVPGETELPKRGGSVNDLLEYIPVGLKLLDAIRLRLVMRKLVVYACLGGDDPCDLAVLYGKATGAAAAAMPLLERAFRIRKRDVQVFCDFTADETQVYAELDIAACPLRLLVVALRYGIQALKIYLKQQKSKKAVQ